MNDTFPKTIEECKQVVEFFSKSTETTEYVRAIKIEGQIVGCIATFFETNDDTKNAEIAYWLN